jgi:hypothetical protein
LPSVNRFGFEAPGWKIVPVGSKQATPNMSESIGPQMPPPEHADSRQDSELSDDDSMSDVDTDSADVNVPIEPSSKELKQQAQQLRKQVTHFVSTFFESILFTVPCVPKLNSFSLTITISICFLLVLFPSWSTHRTTMTCTND